METQVPGKARVDGGDCVVITSGARELKMDIGKHFRGRSLYLYVCGALWDRIQSTVLGNKYAFEFPAIRYKSR